MAHSPRSRALRWAAPLVVAAIIGLVALVPTFSAAATPRLPAATTEQLIARVEQSNDPPLTGSVRLTASLGLPSLSSLGNAGRGASNGFNPTDLLSGSHQARVWYDGPNRSRIALPRSMAETDAVHNGRDLWLWDSTGAKVTHFLLPATDEGNLPEPIKTPDEMAKDLLSNLDPSTVVSVGNAAYVAGRPAYELLLQPRKAESTIDHVGIAVDSASGLPLRVTVFAKGQRKPAVQLGFTSVSFSRPAPSRFTFTPPPDSSVTTRDLTSDRSQGGPDQTGKDLNPLDPTGATGGQQVTVGQDWTQVDIFSNVDLPRGAYEVLRSASDVSGAFGTGRLVQGTLINVLLVEDGRIAVGAVSPQALEAAVASTP
jgi:outer membrane lipoprotein-sorting protein